MLRRGTPTDAPREETAPGITLRLSPASGDLVRPPDDKHENDNNDDTPWRRGFFIDERV